MADLIEVIRHAQFLNHKGSEHRMGDTDIWVWQHEAGDECLGCRAVALVDELVAAMDYRPCVRFDMEPCRSRPEIPEDEWCHMCKAWEIRTTG